MRAVIASPIGDVVVETGEGGVLACGTWIERAEAGDDSVLARGHLEVARAALHEYFAGRRRAFADVALSPRGTDFQREVWGALCELPYARTTTYGRLAARLGRPRAIRAVGQANARNPIGIFQPCHRVIGVDGRLVGFAGGLTMKRWLLDHERRTAGHACGYGEGEDSGAMEGAVRGGGAGK